MIRDAARRELSRTLFSIFVWLDGMIEGETQVYDSTSATKPIDIAINGLFLLPCVPV